MTTLAQRTIVTRLRSLMDFTLRSVRFYPGVNSRAELVTLAPLAQGHLPPHPPPPPPKKNNNTEMLFLGNYIIITLLPLPQPCESDVVLFLTTFGNVDVVGRRVALSSSLSSFLVNTVVKILSWNSLANNASLRSGVSCLLSSFSQSHVLLTGQVLFPDLSKQQDIPIDILCILPIQKRFSFKNLTL